MGALEFKKDFLTGFHTRETLISAINELRSNYDTYKKAFSILLFDIDHFKSFNDKYGHLIGDEVLKYFSSSIRLDLVAEQVTLFRFGGDEFLVLFHAADAEESSLLASRLLENIKARPCNVRGNQLKMSFSGGIASYPADGWTAEELLEKADKALYTSKKDGRGKITLHTKLRQRKVQTLAIAAGAVLAAVSIWGAVRLGFHEKVWNELRKAPSVAVKLKKASLRALVGANEWKNDVAKKWEDLFAAKTTTIERALNPSVGVDLEAYLDGQKLPETPPLDEPETAGKNSEAPDAIYLKSGGVVHGRIISRSGGRVTVEFYAGPGRGTIVLKTEDIIRIEKTDPEI